MKTNKILKILIPVVIVLLVFAVIGKNRDGLEKQ